MNDLVIVNLPKIHDKIAGLWYNGYPVHRGIIESSINYATLHAHEQKIIPDQKRIHDEHGRFRAMLQKAGFRLHAIPFPEELNQEGNLHHDAIFLRDAGLMIGDIWVQARFSVPDRHIEAQTHAKVITQTFNKKNVTLPKEAYMEFGEVYFLQTARGSYYFGGLSRSNKAGHDAVRKIIKPDHFCLIESQSYHLDTVMSPVVSNSNELVALLVVESMLSETSLKNLYNLNVQIIRIYRSDASGTGTTLGSYAINALVAPGILLNCGLFTTPGIEEKLQKLGIRRFYSSLTDFRFAGGSYHCLTNEIY